MTEQPAPDPGEVIARIRALVTSLQPGERRVAEVFLDRPEWVIEASSGDIGEAARVSRATVVRTCQRMGFAGYPQLRVLLARDLGVGRRRAPGALPHAGRPIDVVEDFYRMLADSVHVLTALLEPGEVAAAVDLLVRAERILVTGNGVSAPVAAEAAMRLVALGQPAEAPSDHIDQRIRARLLTPRDACLIVSGTGATTTTLEVAEAARRAGAPVIALTGFTRSPLAELATVCLVTGMHHASFSDEITRSLRIPQTLLVNALITAVAARAPEQATRARTELLDVLGGVLADPAPKPG